MSIEISEVRRFDNDTETIDGLDWWPYSAVKKYAKKILVEGGSRAGSIATGGILSPDDIKTAASWGEKAGKYTYKSLSGSGKSSKSVKEDLKNADIVMLDKLLGYKDKLGENTTYKQIVKALRLQVQGKREKLVEQVVSYVKTYDYKSAQLDRKAMQEVIDKTTYNEVLFRMGMYYESIKPSEMPEVKPETTTTVVRPKKSSTKIQVKPVEDEGMSTGAKVAIIGGSLVVLGGIAYLAMRKR